MNGAEALLRTLVDGGVEVLFTNPGTTELHLVGALDAVPELRGVLALFEGVATGAADGYARIADKPAATLLHLGPGLAYGLTNLHNSRCANSPVVNIVGDHATYHNTFDPPLNSDIAALAGWLRGAVRRPENAAGAGTDAAATLEAAAQAPGQVATVIMPADVSWNDGGMLGVPVVPGPAPTVTEEVIARVAEVMRGGEVVALIIGGPALRAGLCAASRIAAASGVRVLQELYSNRVERGAGLPAFPRLGFYPDQVRKQLAGVRHVIVAGAKAPVSFFAYPDQPSCLVPQDARTHTLAEVGQDAVAALVRLADLVAPDTAPQVTEPRRPPTPSGPLTLQNWCDVVAALLPDQAIVIDETVSSGTALAAATAGSARHDVLMQTGGAMGDGMPLAVGAAVAAPDRPVVTLEADGCAMYTITALRTQAREQVNVTTIILNNRAYAILRQEWQYFGSRPPGAAAPDTNTLLDISGPAIDFVKLAEALGVPASRASTAEQLAEQFSRALAEPGPHLVDATIAPLPELPRLPSAGRWPRFARGPVHRTPPSDNGLLGGRQLVDQGSRDVDRVRDDLVWGVGHPLHHGDVLEPGMALWHAATARSEVVSTTHRRSRGGRLAYTRPTSKISNGGCRTSSSGVGSPYTSSGPIITGHRPVTGTNARPACHDGMIRSG